MLAALDEEVAPGYRREGPASAVCVDPAGRRWVLKPVPDDCRYDGGLHPVIADRLARVRDLPHARVATLLGVVRGVDPAAAHLVWAHVDGVPIDQWTPSADIFPTVARNLASAVELLHARGLVHGALTGGNVIVRPDGDVWLTHISPYLWTDPAEDVRAVIELLRPVTTALSLPPPDLDAEPTSAALRGLAERWSATAAGPPLARDRRIRWGPLTVAAFIAVVAIAFAVVLHARLGLGPK